MCFVYILHKIKFNNNSYINICNKLILIIISVISITVIAIVIVIAIAIAIVRAIVTVIVAMIAIVIAIVIVLSFSSIYISWRNLWTFYKFEVCTQKHVFIIRHSLEVFIFVYFKRTHHLSYVFEFWVLLTKKSHIISRQWPLLHKNKVCIFRN